MKAHVNERAMRSDLVRLTQQTSRADVAIWEESFYVTRTRFHTMQNTFSMRDREELLSMISNMHNPRATTTNVQSTLQDTTPTGATTIAISPRADQQQQTYPATEGAIYTFASPLREAGREPLLHLTVTASTGAVSTVTDPRVNVLAQSLPPTGEAQQLHNEPDEGPAFLPAIKPAPELKVTRNRSAYVAAAVPLSGAQCGSVHATAGESVHTTAEESGFGAATPTGTQDANPTRSISITMEIPVNRSAPGEKNPANS